MAEEKQECYQCDVEKWKHKKPHQTVPVCEKHSEQNFNNPHPSLGGEK